MVARVHVRESAPVDDALFVGKGVKALAAVVGAHARGAHAAKAHLGGGQVDDGVVHAPAAEGQAAEDLALRGAAAREEVERQGLFVRPDKADHLGQAVHGEDGQDGAEDLLAHGGRGAALGQEQRGLHAQPLRPPAAEDLAPGEQSLQPREVLFVDDARVFGVLERFLAEHAPELPLQRGDQRLRI